MMRSDTIKKGLKRIPHRALLSVMPGRIGLRDSEHKDPLYFALLIARTVGDSFALRQVAEYNIKLGRKDRAREVISYILKKKIRRVSEKLSFLIDIAECYIELADRVKAKKLLAQSLKLAKTLKSKKENFFKEYKLDSLAVNYARLGEYKKAFKVIRTLKSFYNKREAMAGIARLYIKARKYKQAFDMIEKAFQNLPTVEVFLYKEFGDKACRDYKTSIYREIAKGYVEIGQFQRAIQVLRKMDREGQPFARFDKCEVLSFLAGKYIETKHIDKACVILSQAAQLTKLPKSPTDSEIYLGREAIGGIARKYAEAGYRDKAFKILSRVRVGKKNKNYLLYQKAVIFAKLKQYDEAFEVAQKSKAMELSVRARLLGEVLYELAKAGKNLTDAQIKVMMAIIK